MSDNDSNDENNTITITDFSLSDELLINTMADDIVPDCGTITISGTDYGTYDFIDNVYTTFDYTGTDPSIAIGKSTLSEEGVRDINAIVEAVKNLPEDNELRIMFETILMMKKIKNED